MGSGNLIEDVSDTSLWVAAYRSQESERPDALFRDPYARLLAGEKGRQIARNVGGSRFTAWAVTIRTCIIDEYIRLAIDEGVTAVLNLGAGLDTRPYRLPLPAGFRWIEVDYPHIIALKNERLREEKPLCRLDRIPLDLNDSEKRTKLLSDISTQSARTLVITEGVLLYLKKEQVASLAESLREQKSFDFWIADFYSPRTIRMMRFGARFRKGLKNAPVQFFPEDWFVFFHEHGWNARESRFYADESKRLGRPAPRTKFDNLFRAILPKRENGLLGRFGGYALFEAARSA
jgi:methyltransferase (TIGR00027 family)